ncbi:uncharacterized protein BXZ73DRAFT_88516 [Epithele typhae]|uniref:uncharacterized protein n=1 Tax=Epithele typhae TaxID=378194 RepID=UPI0020072881|nr:uncharacterized protein BXZ73DRAFT_88516 [Epithele typhae]KAH9940801.1 hypothetical protein BXZ73DRAFT_88516 [Epithele typhae]
MGRRKIEIQPITHERNRSVTFLKRKNGLFKKAYELGVLCSVDVAVIIFEERPGHHAKLYQYCSTDVNGMVQRHLRFDGERDTKGPPDFNNNSKATEEAMDEDEDGDDDEGSQSQKRGGKITKVKTEGPSNSIVPIRPGPPSNDVSASPEEFRSNLRVSPDSVSGLPLSGERHTSGLASSSRSIPISSTAKRPRLMEDPGHSRSPHPHGAGAQSAPPNLAHTASSPPFPFRLDVDLPASYPIPSLAQLHSPHPSLSSIYPSHSAAAMSGLMSGSSQSYLSQSYGGGNGGGGQQAPLRAVTFPHGHGHGSQYSPHGHQGPQSIFARTGGAHASHSSSANNIFAELLGTGDHHPNGGGGHGGGGGGSSGNGFPSFDWPVHSTQASTQSGQHSHDHSAPQSTSPSADSSNWFDFLSAPLPTSSSNPGAPPGSSGVGGGARFHMPASSVSPPGGGRKRLRDDSVGADGMGIGVVNKG